MMSIFSLLKGLKFSVVSLWKFNGYLSYKTISSENMPSEAEIKILFHRKVMLRSWDIQVFLFLTISWFTESDVIMSIRECIFEYIVWTTTH